jgi:hypothetical protein
MPDISKICPHCGLQLVKWRVPEGANWVEEFFYACFNDDCSYYREGWDWMRSQFNQAASYRYMINPSTGVSSMLPVWSASSMREMIVEEDEGGKA